MIYEKRTLKKGRKAKGHEGRVEVFFLKCACQQAGGQGENREQKVICPDIPVHPVQEKKT